MPPWEIMRQTPFWFNMGVALILEEAESAARAPSPSPMRYSLAEIAGPGVRVMSMSEIGG